MESLRSRLDLALDRPRNFSKQRQQFEEVRSNLNGYCQILASNYLNTGLSIHQILSGAMVSAANNERFPELIHAEHNRLRTRKDFSNVGREDIARVVDLSSRFVERHASLDDLGLVWSQVAATVFTPFHKADIESGVKAWVDSLTSLARLIKEFEGKFFSIEGQPLKDYLALLSDSPVLEELQGTPPEVLGEQRRAVISHLADYEKFLDEAKKYRALHGQEFDEALSTKLSDLSALSDELDAIPSTDVLPIGHEPGILRQSKLEVMRSREEDTVAALEGALRIAGEFFPYLDPAFQDLVDIPFSKISIGSEIVNACAESVLRDRDRYLHLEGRLKDVKELGNQVAELERERSQLEAHFRFAALPDLDRLGAILQAFEEAGTFAFLSGKYRLAKREYLAFVVDVGFDRAASCVALERLISYQEEVARLETGSLASTVFPDGGSYEQFTIEEAKSVGEYFEAIEGRLPGLGQRALKSFLKKADLTLIKALPSFDEAPNTSFSELEGLLARHTVRRDYYANRLKGLLPQFELIDRFNLISVVDLGVLSEQVEGHLKREGEFRQHEYAQFSEDLEQSGRLSRYLESLSSWNKELVTRPPLAKEISGYVSTGAGFEIYTALQGIESALLAASEQRRKTIATLELPQGWLDDVPMGKNLTCPNVFRTSELIKTLDEAGANVDKIEQKVSFNELAKQLFDEGFEPTYKALESEDALDQLPNLIECVSWRCLAAGVYEKYGGDLSRFSGQNLDEARAQLSELDIQILDNTRLEVAEQALALSRPPTGVGMGKKSEFTELALIQHEVSKKQRFISVRDLIQRAGVALRHLKPCWMMSPESVAKYLPRIANQFDLVIIDEASQMRPENAIGCLYRAQQAVVAGDTNQLPPTTFYRSQFGDGDEDEDSRVVEESILELANSAYRPRRRLRWHYRSRHAALIAFSNRFVYDDDLILFPSANESREDMGVKYVPVNGFYRRGSGTNPIEAAAMADAVIEFMSREPDKSLGAVVMNKAQADLLQSEIDYRVASSIKAQHYESRWAGQKNGL